MAKTEATLLVPSVLTTRGRRTRGLLLDAARAVFERAGFAAARVTDIADQAGVAHGTFYTYFDAKEDVFREVILSVHQEMLSGAGVRDVEVDFPTAATPEESITRANQRFLEAYRRNAQIMVIWEQAATLNQEFAELLHQSRERFTGRSESFIRELQERGRADPYLDPRYAAHALGAMVSKFAYNWFAGGEDFDFDESVEQLSRLWASALGLSSQTP